MIDSDLAALYGVSTKALNQAVKRNTHRFPPDFAFRLTAEEKEKVVTNCDHLMQLRFSPALPSAFTEHGAIMAAMLLNSPRAIEASVYVVRAFVKLRTMLVDRREFARRLVEVERLLVKHDTAIREIVAAIQDLTMLPEKPETEKPKIGFRVGESGVRYGKRH
jgi:hypothetical protein